MKVRALSAFVAACIGFGVVKAEPTRPAAPKSGITYATEQVRALQIDDAANPGMLWITRGESLWNAPEGSRARSCASCHGDASMSMKGIATRFPHAHTPTQKIINLEARINQCRVQHQGGKPFAYDTPELLGLTAFVAHQSRGLPRHLTASASQLQRGEKLYQQRMGQMNLACVHCHDHNVGKILLSEKISEGHANAYPLYRLEWQTMGSLHRRLRSCMVGIRAEPFAPGSDEFLALEFYLAWRGNGLAIETPGVRR